MQHLHTFHIPVMGLAFTLDSPIKVAPYGISSAIALANDTIIEHLREFYANKFGYPYQRISVREPDYRSKRIREYLNLVDVIVKRKFEELKSNAIARGSELEKYLEMLPELAEIKDSFRKLAESKPDSSQVWNWIKDHLSPGSIDVNIMTKLDKENFSKGEKLPVEYNDAHAALRGFATSTLQSSLVLSAGMNPYLYSYLEKFDAFYPNSEGVLEKKIILKVSDYRSAIIQGKMLAKKGIWVSEFRVESGLNCGGHAFATDGYLMGPVLEEFKTNRQELSDTLFAIYREVLLTKGFSAPEKAFEIRITAQGGVGTAEEHHLLVDYFGVDSVGWGTPFLLVPDATTVDNGTMQILAEGKEEDFYLSNVSPLGVPFNSVRNNTKDIEKMERVAAGNPGSPCTLQHLKLFRDEDGNPICTASKEYQQSKLAEVETSEKDPVKLQKIKQNIFDKVCLCVGLATSAKLVYGIDTKSEGTGVAICPGPNMAWFTRIVSLTEMSGHIYGRNSVIERKNRPHMFVNELKMYVDHLRNKISDLEHPINNRTIAQLKTYRDNLLSGISYYRNLFEKLPESYATHKDVLLGQLDGYENEVSLITIE